MSNRYKGAVISATPPTTTGGSSGTASGAWTLEQQMQLQAAGLWPSQPPPPNIEDVFSTYIYTGNDTTQTITNGIDLATKGGIVWIKPRNQVQDHVIFDTVGGITKSLASNNASAQYTATGGTEGLVSFNTTGFTTRLYQNSTGINNSGCNLASWTFAKQPKFFDIQTYTGTGVAGKIVTHNLGSVPGCIMVKKTSGVEDWCVYHVGAGSVWTLVLNDTAAKDANNNFNYTTGLTSTEFQVGSNSPTNQNGATYVAYLFAHNAGGFGLTGTDNVISCGSYTRVDANGTDVNLGYEPQWVMLKPTNAVGDWYIADIMRNNSNTNRALLAANSSGAEIGNDGVPSVIPTATGFKAINIYSNGNTVAYIAIRRGPMAVPTLGTTVFSPIVANNAQGTQNTTGFPVDLQWAKYTGGAIGTYDADRLRGVSTNSTTGGQHLITSSTAAEVSSNATQFWNNTGFQTSSGWSSTDMVYENFRRAPGFFDVVCYSTTIQGTQANNHNLGVAPELMIIKKRSSSGTSWIVYSAFLGAGATAYLWLNQDYQAGWFGGGVYWANTSPTTTQFTVGGDGAVTGNSETYVAYLFATCPGVSKVGSYTGTGALQTVACGFTTGARFVLIKRTDSTGSWYVWDSARGISSSTDPYFLLNSTAAQVTGTNYVDTDTTGFKVTAAAPADINASGGTYIFLAIA